MWLSKNFHADEFRCRCADAGKYKPGTQSEYCGGLAIVQPVLVEKLQELRDRFGAPVVITSGYRCPAYNRKVVKGSEMSWHMSGYAADIWVRGVGVLEVGKAADELGFRGIEVYPDKGFVHVDMRPWGAVWRGDNYRRLIGNA